MWSYHFINNVFEGKMRCSIILSWSLILLLSCCVQGGQEEMNKEEMNKGEISCKMVIATPQNLTDGIFVTFSIDNPLDETISLLSWYTPFEGFLSNLFVILDINGIQLSYQGPMVKRAAPLAKDYIVLLANEKKAITLDLTQGYELSKGLFTVRLQRLTLQGKDKAANLVNITCVVDVALLQIN